jgi:DNA-binding IclR family transcriptional regulator
MKKDTNNGVRRSLEIVKQISFSKDGLSFSHLKESLGNVTPATLSRLLKVLIEEEWVEKNEEGIYISGKEAKLLTYYQSPEKNKIEIIDNAIKDLAEKTGESAAFAEYAGAGFAFKSKHEMGESFHFIDINKRSTDIFKNGFGIMTLAWQSEAEQQKVLSSDKERAKRFNDNWPQTWKEVREKKVRVSTDNGIRVVSPVMLHDGKTFIGTVGISIIPKELSENDVEKHKEAVLYAAREISDKINKIML